MKSGSKLPRRVVALILVVPGLVACGSGSKARSTESSTAGPTAAGATPATGVTAATGVAAVTGKTQATSAVAAQPTRPQAPASKSLHVVLSATAPPSGSGKASLQVYVAAGEVCWKFQKLTGITAPSGAAIGIGDVGGGAVEFSLGDHYSPAGCTKAAFARTGLQEIVETPGDFFVELSTGSGESATQRLRGQLAKGILASASPSDSAPPSFND